MERISIYTVKVGEKLDTEVNKLIPGKYINKTEFVLKAIRKMLIEEHGVKF